MWVLVRSKTRLEAKFFKHKLIRYYVYIFINKMEGKEVEVVKYGL